MKRLVFPGLFFTTLGAVLALLLVPRGDRGDAPGARPGESRRTALVTAAERVAPGVVSILCLDRPGPPEPVTSYEDLYSRQLLGDIQPFTGEGMVTRHGSGIIIDANGFFLTNEHVVRSAGTILVTLSDGRRLDAVLVGSDAEYDLAVLRVREQMGPVFPTVPIGHSDSLLVGEWVVAVGNPYGELLQDPRPSVTAGVISAIHRDVVLLAEGIVYKNMIQTDASINPGNSGGPLVNARGDVIGINTFIISRGYVSVGLNFAIPIETAMELAGDIILYGRVPGVWSGIMVRGLSLLPEPMLARLGITDVNGVVVWTLDGGSPAAQAGIQLGDVIRAINGRPVTDAEGAQVALFGSRVGDTVTFRVDRRGERFEIPVVLERRPGESMQREVP